MRRCLGFRSYQVYRCRDGWVTLGALEEKFWAAWCRGVGRPDLLGHRYDSPESPAYHEVAAIFAARTKAEWAEFGAGHDCCVTVVRGMGEALHSPLVTERETVVDLRQDEDGEPYQALALPVRLSRTPPDPAGRPAPALGADTAALLDGASSAPAVRAAGDGRTDK